MGSEILFQRFGYITIHNRLFRFLEKSQYTLFFERTKILDYPPGQMDY